MPSVSVRTTKKQLKMIDRYVDSFEDSNRSEVVRDAALKQAKKVIKKGKVNTLKKLHMPSNSSADAIVFNVFMQDEDLDTIEKAASMIGHRKSNFVLFAVLAEIEKEKNK